MQKFIYRFKLFSKVDSKLRFSTSVTGIYFLFHLFIYIQVYTFWQILIACCIHYTYLHIFFQTRDLFKVFQVVPTTLLNFLTTLENHYLKSVPYHNNLHAADVTQSIHVLLNSPALEVNKEFLMKFSPALTIFFDYFFLWQFQFTRYTYLM